MSDSFEVYAPLATNVNANRAVVPPVAAARVSKVRCPTAQLPSPSSNNGAFSVSPSAFGRSPTPTRSVSRGRVQAAAARQPSASIPRLPDSLLLRYEREGFVQTPRLLQPEQMSSLRASCEQLVASRRLDSLRHRIRVLCPGVDPDSVTSEAEARAALEDHATDDLGFLQFFNLHRINKAVARVALSPELASVASQLLGVRRVRVYQDCLFLKEPGFAETNWHSDLRMAPLDTNDFITAWIPLRPILGAHSGSDKAAAARSPPDSGLIFAAGSHRDFALPFWHDMDGRDLSDRGYAIKDTGPMEVGDVSWHHGWTLHCAAPQPVNTPPRLALSVAFFADGARLLARRSDPSVRAELLHDEDEESYSAWLPALAKGKGKDGAVARHKLLPVVWPLDASEADNFPLGI
ncbi:hypothetical protein GPECTOR_1g217 [Gonium pectorale]|uniref:Phytanoyl-CoA dioxygenase n=1 Tax=Gonium pectorale TaxID=33097 RepID=A0A150H279_GONPE|nr:hypothetical protein GPECTOR_1g217 [Gonium pectorale]|eukprot:KXZ56249.1 hypothetical protein GPECTOR_1g217 [Gonium pectorale]